MSLPNPVVGFVSPVNSPPNDKPLVLSSPSSFSTSNIAFKYEFNEDI